VRADIAVPAGLPAFVPAARSEAGFARFGSCIEVRVSASHATLETNISAAAPSHAHAPGISVDCSRNGEPSRSHGYDKQLFPHGLPPLLSRPPTVVGLGNGPQFRFRIGDVLRFNKTFEPRFHRLYQT